MAHATLTSTESSATAVPPEAAGSPTSGGGRRRDAIACLVLVIWGAVVFLGALRNGFTLWDDPTYVTQNPLIEEFSSSSLLDVFTSFNYCNYHPLTYVTYMVEYALVGHAPWLYHLDNVLLHLASAVFAYLLAKRWMGSCTGAFMTAALFLVHPLRVESVAWVSERKDVLCVAFYFASLLVYTREGATASRRSYVLALGLFVFSLLAKVMAITLPAVLVLWHLYRRERVPWRGILPFAVLGIVFAVLGVLAQAEGNAVSGPHGGTWWNHFLSLPKALAFYLSKLLLPLGLSPRYTLEGATGLTDPWSVAGLVVVAVGGGLLPVALRRLPLAAFGVGFFLVTWAPASGIVPSVTFVADRYMYLPAFGLFLAAVSGASQLVRLLSEHRLARPVLVGSGVLCLSAASWLSIEQVSRWRDNETLWLWALETEPDNEFAHNQLSATYGSTGRFRKALEHSVSAIQLGLHKPEYLFNLCRAYRGLEDYEKELACAREIERGEPRFLPARLVSVRQALERGDLADVGAQITALDRRFPGAAPVIAARAAQLEASGRSDEAVELYFRLYPAQSRDVEFLLGFASALASRGETLPALAALTDALEQPGGVWFPDLWRRLDGLLEKVEAAGATGPRREALDAVRKLAHGRRAPAS